MEHLFRRHHRLSRIIQARKLRNIAARDNDDNAFLQSSVLSRSVLKFDLFLPISCPKTCPLVMQPQPEEAESALSLRGKILLSVYLTEEILCPLSVSQLISGPVRGRPLLRPSVRQISLNGVRRHRSPLPGRGGEYVRVRALQVEAGEKKMIAKLARRVENSRT